MYRWRGFDLLDEGRQSIVVNVLISSQLIFNNMKTVMTAERASVTNIHSTRTKRFIHID